MKRGNVSLAALAAIIPFLDKLDELDINYITGKNRLSWYDDLWKRSLKLKSGEYSKKANVGYHNNGQAIQHPRYYKSWRFKLQNKIKLLLK
jgi:hypothetical protein